MDKELLHLQQYLHIHPILEKNKLLLKQWMMPNEEIIAVEIDAKNNIVFAGKIADS